MGSKKLARKTATLVSDGPKGRRRVRKHVLAAATRSFVLAAGMLVAFWTAVFLLGVMP